MKPPKPGRPPNPKAPRRTFTWQAHPDDLKEWEAGAKAAALPFQTWVKATLTREARRLKAEQTKEK